MTGRRAPPGAAPGLRVIFYAKRLSQRSTQRAAP